MQRRWTEEAANDLERIADYLLTHAPDRASDLVRAVYDAPYALLTLARSLSVSFFIALGLPVPAACVLSWRVSASPLNYDSSTAPLPKEALCF